MSITPLDDFSTIERVIYYRQYTLAAELYSRGFTAGQRLERPL